jgi:hypothetical protein
MNNTEYATLCLPTAYGITNVLNTTCYWPNINIRTLLGPMYDKYDLFNLSLESILISNPQHIVVAGNNVYAGNTGDDQMVLISMSGLPFLNSTYNVRTGCNGSSTILSSTYIGNNGQSSFITYNDIFRTFGKAADIVNITISFIKYDLSSPITAVPFPNFTFIFNIRGIPKDEDNLNNTRMIR